MAAFGTGTIAKKAIVNQRQIKIIGSQKYIEIKKEIVSIKASYAVLTGKSLCFGNASLKIKTSYPYGS